MTVPYFYRNDNSRFLSVEGQDSSDFLQNLITNDVNKCTKENIIYSCLLTPQGKFMADFFILFFVSACISNAEITKGLAFKIFL